MDKPTEPQAQPPEAPELKPCPFCGGQAFPFEEVDEVDSSITYYWIECSSCYAESRRSNFSENAARAWNTRADLPRAAAEANEAANELAAVLIAIRDCKNDTKCSVCASIIRHALIRAKSRATTPRVETGLTVEAALAELREIFPVPPLKIVEIVEWTMAGRRVRWNIEINQFCISSVFGNIDDPSQPATLERAMIAVRAWAKSRVEKEGESS